MTPSPKSCSRADTATPQPSPSNLHRPLAQQLHWAILSTLLGLAFGAHADWPQFLGPQRDGSAPALAPNTSFAHEDQAGKPRWKIKVGAGFSSPIIVQNNVLLFHRLNDQDVLESFQLSDGKSLWKLTSPTRYVDDFGFDEGPRATPAAASNTVVTLSAEGNIQAAEITSGKRLWEIAGKEQFNARKGFFGLASSPLIVNNTVIAMIGGTDGASILGIDLRSGKIRWKTGSDDSSYASPVLTQWQQKERLLLLTRESLQALTVDTGAVLWNYGWRPPMHASVSAATPLIQGNEVFLSASYGTPAVLLKVDEAGATEIWKNSDAMANHYATCVLHEGHLYGFHGRQETGCSLRCVEWSTGKVKWTEENFGAGTLIRVGSDLVILAESGELIRATASPKGYKPSARFQILGSKTRAHAAYSDGTYVARSPRELVCIDLLKR